MVTVYHHDSHNDGHWRHCHHCHDVDTWQEIIETKVNYACFWTPFIQPLHQTMVLPWSFRIYLSKKTMMNRYTECKCKKIGFFPFKAPCPIIGFRENARFLFVGLWTGDRPKSRKDRVPAHRKTLPVYFPVWADNKLHCSVAETRLHKQLAHARYTESNPKPHDRRPNVLLIIASVFYVFHLISMNYYAMMYETIRRSLMQVEK